VRTLARDGCIETPTVVPTAAGTDFRPCVTNVSVSHAASLIEWVNGTAFDNLGRERGVEAELKERYHRLVRLPAACNAQREVSTAGWFRAPGDEAGLGEQPCGDALSIQGHASSAH
jgi:hypothetical protein